jgi:DNA-binding SARP family transcriptional activator
VYELKVLDEPVRIEGTACVDRFPTKKCKALLCYLSVAPNHRARREAIIADLWPEEFEDTARKALRQTLYHIRSTVRGAGLDPEIVRSSGEHVWIDSDLLEVDADCFATLAVAGLEAGDEESAMAALELCPSGFDGCDDGLWVGPARERVADLLRRVRLRVARGFLARSESQSAHDCAMAVIFEHPFDETAYEIGIQALLQLRDRSAARELYDRFERDVIKELGGEMPFDWDDLAAMYPVERPHLLGHQATAVIPPTKRRTTVLRRFTAVGLAAAVIIGGWSASGVRGVPPEGPLTPTQAGAALKVAFEAQGRDAKRNKISTVRRVFESAWTGAYAATEDEWAAVIRRFKQPIIDTLRDARKSDPDATIAIAGAGWRYFVNDGLGENLQATLKEGLDRGSHKPSPERARALCALSFDITETGPARDALPIAREALDMYRKLGSGWGEAHANRAIGFAYAFEKDWPQAHLYYGRALEGFRRIGSREGMAVTQLCRSFASPGPSGEMTKWMIEALESYIAVDNQWGLEYAGDALRTLVKAGSYQGLNRDCGIRAAKALEHLLGDSPNQFSTKSLDTRRAIINLGLCYQLDEVTSRQLEWFVRYQNLALSTAATFYGASVSDASKWPWLEERIEEDRAKGGRLEVALSRGRELGLEKVKAQLLKELGISTQ